MKHGVRAALSPRQILVTSDGLIVEACDSLWNRLNSAAFIAAARGIDAPGGTEPESAEFPGAEFPGIVVQYAEKVVGAVGCTFEPDGSISTTPPVLTPAADWKMHAAIVQALYQGVESLAVEQRAFGVHCLFPESDDCSPVAGTSFGTEQLMEYSGLQKMAIVARLEKSLLVDQDFLPSVAGSEGEEEITAARLHGDANPVRAVEAMTDRRIEVEERSASLQSIPLAALQSGLDEILKHSHDLPEQIRPGGLRLLSTWEQRAAWLILFHRQLEVIGIAAVSGIPSAAACLPGRGWPEPDPSAVTGALPANSTQTLEYIGIHPLWRRQGLGRQLLQTVEERIVRSCRLLQQNQATVTVYSDIENTEAMNLYAAYGYRQAERYSLWYRLLHDDRGVDSH